MSSDSPDSYFRRYAGELIEQGAAFPERTPTQNQEVARWHKYSLNVLKQLDADAYQGILLETFDDEQTKRAAILHALREATGTPYDSKKEAATKLRIRRLVGDTAAELGIDVPQSIDISESAAYYYRNDRVTFPKAELNWPEEEQRATAGHELTHKHQHKRNPRIAAAYVDARLSLPLLAKELLKSNRSPSFLFRAATMLTSMSAYTTHVLLGKTMGYQHEFEADQGGAKASSPEAVVSVLRRDQYIREKEAQRRRDEPLEPEEQPWRERVKSYVRRIGHLLEDDHPPMSARIDRLIGGKKSSREQDRAVGRWAAAHDGTTEEMSPRR